MTRVVLASRSPARLAVLRAAGIDPLVRVSGVDEDAVTASLGPGATDDTVVAALAHAKAAVVVSGAPDGSDPELTDALADAVVIGCDSMLSIAGGLVGKPVDADTARRRWTGMAGHAGELLTGHSVVVVKAGRVTASAAAVSTTTVHFGTPSDDELDAYIASGEPLEVAGAFTLDGLGGWFVDRIDGDPSSVIGIGLPLVRRLLGDVGVSIAALWSANPVVR